LRSRYIRGATTQMEREQISSMKRKESMRVYGVERRYEEVTVLGSW
jgi:hypothetical protein